VLCWRTVRWFYCGVAKVIRTSLGIRSCQLNTLPEGESFRSLAEAVRNLATSYCEGILASRPICYDIIRLPDRSPCHFVIFPACTLCSAHFNCHDLTTTQIKVISVALCKFWAPFVMQLYPPHHWFLSFSGVRKIKKSDYKLRHVCPSVRPPARPSVHCTDGTT